MRNSTKPSRGAALRHIKHNDTLFNYILRKKRCQAFFRRFSVFFKKIPNAKKRFPFFRQEKANFMRIDKFLKVSRILKRRTVAQEACGEQKVLINGKPAKPATKIKIGDVVEILYATGVLKFRIVNIKETVKKEEASSLYEVIV
jgi:ribosomal 50S subunit-recycling heat shock protein